MEPKKVDSNVLNIFQISKLEEQLYNNNNNNCSSCDISRKLIEFQILFMIGTCFIEFSHLDKTGSIGNVLFRRKLRKLKSTIEIAFTKEIKWT